MPVRQVSLFFHLSGGGVVGLFRFSYNVPPNQKTPGATSISFENKNLSRVLIILIIIQSIHEGLQFYTNHNPIPIHLRYIL